MSDIHPFLWEAVITAAENKDLQRLDAVHDAIHKCLGSASNKQTLADSSGSVIDLEGIRRRRIGVPDGFVHYDRLKPFLDEHGLRIQDVDDWFIAFVKLHHSGAIITRRAFCDYIASCFPASSKVMIGDTNSLAAYNLASTTIDKARKNPHYAEGIKTKKVNGGVRCYFASGKQLSA